MKITETGVPQDTARISHVETLLARYPAVSQAEVDDLKAWFKSEASAMDVATMAGRDTLAAPYAAFRAEHIDPLGIKDYAAVGIALVLMAGALLFFLL